MQAQNSPQRVEPPIGRRIKAAMALAGINSFADLAERIDSRGMGERTLRKIADDRDEERVPRRGDLLLIAEITGVPISFFFGDPFGSDEVPTDMVVRGARGFAEGLDAHHPCRSEPCDECLDDARRVLAAALGEES